MTNWLTFWIILRKRGSGSSMHRLFAMGLLSQRGKPEWHPAPAALVEACRKASDYCLSQGYPIEKLAIQYSVSNPRIGTTLFQFCQSGQRAQEYTIYRGADRLGFGGQGKRDHRRPAT